MAKIEILIGRSKENKGGLDYCEDCFSLVIDGDLTFVANPVSASPDSYFASCRQISDAWYERLKGIGVRQYAVINGMKINRDGNVRTPCEFIPEDDVELFKRTLEAKIRASFEE